MTPSGPRPPGLAAPWLGAVLGGVLAICALGALGGCARDAAPVRFYLLAAVAPPAASAARDDRPGTIGVGPVRLPSYLDRLDIVTRRGAEEIDLDDQHRWGEPLADCVPRTIADNLTALMPSERIALFPWVPTRSIQYQVVVDVARFDGPLAGPVVLDARWRVIGADRRDVVDRRFTISEPTGAATYPAMVAAMSRALGGLSREIATALRGL